jgi:hypothetical protein
LSSYFKEINNISSNHWERRKEGRGRRRKKGKRKIKEIWE